MVEINNNRIGNYSKKKPHWFDTITLKSNLCDYSDAYKLVKRNLTVVGQGNDAAAIAAERNNKQVIFKNCAPFTSWISKINDANLDNAEDIDIVIQE